jgi:hypothetical protein
MEDDMPNMRLLVGACMVLAASQVQAAYIKEILNDPRTYVDHTVTVQGEVTGVLSLFVFKYFTLNDRTGKINVVTERPLPRQGQTIKVTGKVKEVFALGSETLLVLVEDEEQSSGKAEQTGQSTTAQLPARI